MVVQSRPLLVIVAMALLLIITTVISTAVIINAVVINAVIIGVMVGTRLSCQHSAQLLSVFLFMNSF